MYKHEVALSKEVEATLAEIEKNTKNSIPSDVSEVVVREQPKTKQPVSLLKMNPLLDKQIYGMTVGYDGRHYVFDTTNTFEVYDDIVNDTTPSETGITLTERIIHFKVTREGVVITQNNDADGTVEVLYSPDINTPFQVVYTSPSDESIYSTTGPFGIDVYDNGLNVFVLIAIYGRQGTAKDLLLSSDGGKTYKVIKTTTPLVGHNSHFHDTKFDPYHGFIWVSEGDTTDNHNISFSRDMGATWEVLTRERQPTAIMPFPKRVIFGRDHLGTGLDSVVKPTLNKDVMTITPHYELKKGVTAIRSYAHSPVFDAKEGYISFAQGTDVAPSSIIATGDSGETFYQVFMGEIRGANAIGMIFGMDENYIFCSGRSYAGKTQLFYSEKVEWE